MGSVFPDPNNADENGIVASGGNFSSQLLIEAYKMLDYDELKDRSLEVLLLNYPEFNLKENESINNRSWTNILSLGLIGKEAIQRPDEISP